MSPRLGRGLSALVVSVLLALGAVRSLVEQGRDVDVQLYSAAAVRANAFGTLPYVSAWVEKGPLGMALYQALFALFGAYNAVALAAPAWLALAALGALLAFALARESGAEGGAGWAAVLFAASLPAVGATLNTELPAAVLAAAAVWLWCRSFRSGPASWRGRFGAGALAAAAFLCRQNAGAVWPLLVAAEAATAWLGHQRAGAAGRRALAVTAGFLSVVGATVAFYAVAGQLEPFVFCFWSYNAGIYVAATKLSAARVLWSPLTAAQQLLRPVPTASVLGLAGIGFGLGGLFRGTDEDRSPSPAAPGAHRVAGAVVAAAAIVLVLSLFVGLRFFTHYFALPLPFWAAIGGVAAERVTAAFRRRGKPGAAAASVAVIVVALGAEVTAHAPWALVRAVAGWTRHHDLAGLADPALVPLHDALGARIGRRLREESAASDRIFVWGMRPHYYAYSGRIPATRFVTCTFLTGLVPWERVAPADDTTRWIVPGAWDLLVRDLEAERPLFILDASDDRLFGRGAYPPAAFPRLADFLAAHYAVAGEDRQDDDRVVVWKRRDPADQRAGAAAPAAATGDRERR